MGKEPQEGTAVWSDWRRENSARLADLFALLADAPVGIALVAGFDGRLLQANPALCRLLGYSEPALRRLTLAELGETGDLVELARRGPDGALLELERSYRRRDGSHASLHVSASRIGQDETGEPYFLLYCARSERSEGGDRLHELAQSDPLTGLPNRVAFSVQLDAALMQAKAGTPSVLLLLDMDNFRSVNDSLGHDVGDELLTVMAERLRAVVRPGDLVARLSGDEFTVLVQGIVLEHDVEIIARRVLSAFAEPVALAGQELFMRASIGVARMPTDGDSASAVLKAADVAMYAAKRQGRGRFQLFRAEMADRVHARLRVSSELHRAVMRGELELHYLPQLSLPGEQLISLEALVRWGHPSRGLLLPAQFIPVAEESALISELGEWVLHAACEQLAQWRAQGLAVPRVAVNVSIHQLRDPGFPELVRRTLEQHGLGTDTLELEITESALIDTSQAVPALEELKAAGVAIAIDDFGTGYSSLDRLRRMPIDGLKVDRSFVADADHDADAAALVHSIVTLAHNLGLSATAEGVERPGQRELLVRHGCDVAAGWMWSPPLPADELEAWLAGVG